MNRPNPIKSKHPNRSRRLVVGGVASPLIGLLIVVLSAAGYFVYRSTFAAAYVTTTIVAVDMTTGSMRPIAGVGLAITPMFGGSSCANYSTSSNSAGSIVFQCDYYATPGGVQVMAMYKAANIYPPTGYELASNSPTKVGSVIPAGGGMPIYVRLIDTDKDGIPDASDNCDTQAGPAGNGGCPVPAPAPTPTPTPTSATTNAPKPTAPKSLTTPKATAPAAASAPAATSAVVADTAPPSRPATVVAETKNQSVGLTWDLANDNTAVVGYRVERSTDQTTWEVLVASQVETQYTDSNIIPGTHYYYRVSALDAAGNASEPTLFDIDATEGEVAVETSVEPSPEEPALTPTMVLAAQTGGGIALLLLLAGGGWWWLRRRQLNQLSSSSVGQSMASLGQSVAPGAVVNPANLNRELPTHGSGARGGIDNFQAAKPNNVNPVAPLAPSSQESVDSSGLTAPLDPSLNKEETPPRR